MDVDARPRVVILQSGTYDMTKYWPEARWFMKLWIWHQVWPSNRVLKERSVIEHLPAKLKCKVLILHGEEDKRTPVGQAEQFGNRAAGARRVGDDPVLPRRQQAGPPGLCRRGGVFAREPGPVERLRLTA